MKENIFRKLWRKFLGLFADKKMVLAMSITVVSLAIFITYLITNYLKDTNHTVDSSNEIDYSTVSWNDKNHQDETSKEEIPTDKNGETIEVTTDADGKIVENVTKANDETTKSTEANTVVDTNNNSNNVTNDNNSNNSNNNSDTNNNVVKPVTPVKPTTPTYKSPLTFNWEITYEEAEERFKKGLSVSVYDTETYNPDFKIRTTRQDCVYDYTYDVVGPNLAGVTTLTPNNVRGFTVEDIINGRTKAVTDSVTSQIVPSIDFLIAVSDALFPNGVPKNATFEEKMKKTYLMNIYTGELITLDKVIGKTIGQEGIYTNRVLDTFMLLANPYGLCVGEVKELVPEGVETPRFPAPTIKTMLAYPDGNIAKIEVINQVKEFEEWGWFYEVDGPNDENYKTFSIKLPPEKGGTSCKKNDILGNYLGEELIATYYRKHLAIIDMEAEDFESRWDSFYNNIVRDRYFSRYVR